MTWVARRSESLAIYSKERLVQAAHERIFKAMDADHDGTVTLEEMQAFMRGH